MINYRAGERSGRLVLVQEEGFIRKKLRWQALCDCGNRVVVMKVVCLQKLTKLKTIWIGMAAIYLAKSIKTDRDHYQHLPT